MSKIKAYDSTQYVIIQGVKYEDAISKLPLEIKQSTKRRVQQNNPKLTNQT